MGEQVKEAIQKAIGRVRSVDPSYFPVYPGGDKQAVADLAVLAQAYLAEHPADDDELVTDEWLRTIGFDGHFPSIKTPVGNIWWVEYPSPEGVRGMHGILRHMPHIKTRGDVRRLCVALGIELKRTTFHDRDNK